MSTDTATLDESIMAAAEPVEPKTYVDGMRLLGAACSVITSRNGEERAGLTATAVVSVCADPPRLAICINRDVRAHLVISESGTVAINVLSAEQEDLAKRFAGMVKDVFGEARFEGGRWYDGAMGAPLLDGALASFDCKVVDAMPVSTHTLFLCEVIGVRTREADDALIYFNRNFLRLPDGQRN